MNERLQQLCALADACSLTSLMLDFKRLTEVHEGLCSGAVQQDVESVAGELGWVDANAVVELLNEAAQGSQEGQFATIRREHTRLFDDPDRPACPYYEGAFINRRYRQEGREAPDEDVLFVNRAANDADRQYKRAGLKRDAQQNIPGDCMVTEMAFLSRELTELAGVERESTSGAGADVLLDAAGAEDVKEAQEAVLEFVRLHMRPWAQDFFSELVRESRSPYFRAVGRWGLLCVDQLRAWWPQAFERGLNRGRS